MWVEVVMLAVVVSVVAALIARRSRRRAWDAPVPPRLPDGATWVPADPLEASFPVERTGRERAIGDAAFVDGFIVGHLVAGADHRVTGAHRDTERAGPATDGWDGPTGDATDVAFDDATDDAFDVAFDVAFDDRAVDPPEDLDDEAFGDPFDDRFDDAVDGWDDDW